MTALDPRMLPLAPDVSDDSAERLVAMQRTANMAGRVQRQLERLAPLVARVPRLAPRGVRPGQRRLKPRLGAVAWSNITPEIAAYARDRVLEESTTLVAASAALAPLRSLAKLAIAPIDAGRAWAVLCALEVRGVSSERRDMSEAFDYEADASEASESAPLC